MPLRDRSDTYLLALLNNDDGTMLSREAARELAARGALPAWASMADNTQADLEAAATQITNDPAVRVPVARGRGMLTGVAGPRTDDGRDPTPPPEFTYQDEADEYYTRPTDPQTGQLLPSPADEAMARRHFVATYGDDGEIGYRMGWDVNGKPVDRRQQAEAYRLLSRSVVDPATGQRVPQWRVNEMDGPTGKFAAMGPTDAARRAMDAEREAEAARSVARRVGVDPAVVARMTPQQRGALQRDWMDRTNRERMDRYRAMAALAGGSQNLNSNNRSMAYALTLLSEDARNEVLTQNMPINPYRAQMEAVGAQNALRMIQGMNLGQGMDPKNPLLRAQADAADIQNAIARRDVRADDEEALADKYAPGSWRPWWLGGAGDGWFIGGYDEFTIAEQQEMYETLLGRGYSPAEAQAAVDRAARDRRASNPIQWSDR